MKILRISLILLLIVEVFFVAGCKKKQAKIDCVHVHVSAITDIIPITDSLVIPYQYTGLISLDSLSIELRKEKFIELLLPAILISKYKLEQDYIRFVSIIEKDTSEWGKDERNFIGNLYLDYKTNDTSELKSRLLTHPSSIVLSQAAIESAWGTSRFFKEANNPFGIWSFNKEEPRISSKLARDGKLVHLRKYENLQGSIDDYFKVIARGPYSQFRKARIKSNNPAVLIPKLVNYSEKKTLYTKELLIIIQKNKLERFDHFTINPEYIK